MPQRLRSLVLAAAGLAAMPALGAWDLVRGTEEVRVSIDTQSIAEYQGITRFRYLVDFRKPQGGEAGGPAYRSVVVSAAVRCKDGTFSLGESEAFTGFTGLGVSLGSTQPSEADKRFAPVQKGSSDEDLFARVCKK